MISFLEDERVPSTKMKLSEFTKKYEKFSMEYRKDTEYMKSQRLLNVNKQNMILQNFENISKTITYMNERNNFDIVPNSLEVKVFIDNKDTINNSIIYEF